MKQLESQFKVLRDHPPEASLIRRFPPLTKLLCKKEDLDHGIKAKLKTLDET